MFQFSKKFLFCEFYPKEIISLMNPSLLMKTATKAVREERFDIRLWRNIGMRGAAIVEHMRPDEISSLLFSYAKLKYRYSPLLKNVALHMPNLSYLCTASEITYILYSFALLKYTNKFVFSCCSKQISRRISDFTPKHLCLLLHSYSLVEFVYPPVIEVLKNRIIEVSDLMQPWQLSVLLSSFVKLKFYDEKIFLILISKTLKNFQNFNSTCLSYVANSFKHIHLQNHYVVEVLQDEVFRKKNEMKSKEISLILNYYANCSTWESDALFQVFQKSIMLQIKTFNVHSLCLVAAAFAKKQLKSGELYETLGNRVGDVSTQLNARHVSSLVYSFSLINYRFGPMLKYGVSHCENFFEDYSFDQVCMLIHSYTKLNISVTTIIDKLLNSLSLFFEKPQPTLTSKLAERCSYHQRYNYNFDNLHSYFLSRDSITPSSSISSPNSSTSSPDYINRMTAEYDSKNNYGNSTASAYVNKIHSWLWLLQSLATMHIYNSLSLELICDQLVVRYNELLLPAKITIIYSLSQFIFSHPIVSHITSFFKDEKTCEKLHLNEEEEKKLCNALVTYKENLENYKIINQAYISHFLKTSSSDFSLIPIDKKNESN